MNMLLRERRLKYISLSTIALNSNIRLLKNCRPPCIVENRWETHNTKLECLIYTGLSLLKCLTQKQLKTLYLNAANPSLVRDLNSKSLSKSSLLRVILIQLYKLVHVGMCGAIVFIAFDVPVLGDTGTVLSEKECSVFAPTPYIPRYTLRVNWILSLVIKKQQTNLSQISLTRTVFFFNSLY